MVLSADEWTSTNTAPPRVCPSVSDTPHDGCTVMADGSDATHANAFVGTDLEAHLRGVGASNLVLAGFMTHMCVNSTARGAFNAGFAPSVVAGATATRALPGPDGTVSASALQSASLAALADMFAVVVPGSAAIPD